MRAILLVGHGSLRPGSGAAMIRMAARVREAGVAPVAEAGFLNYSRPTFAQALDRCVNQGASEVVVVPYFLVPGKFVSVDLPRLLTANQAHYPNVPLQLAQPFGDHPALAELVNKRARAATQDLDVADTALLLMAHGSPHPESNQPIYHIVDQIVASGYYTTVRVAFMELNQPSILVAIDEMVTQGIERIVAVPYFLQLGGHVAEDLPSIIVTAQTSHPQATIALAEHLGYDPLLVKVIAARFREQVLITETQRSSE